MSNVSICNESTQAKFVVIVYNPLSHVVSHHVRLPVKDGSFRVFGPDGEQNVLLLTFVFLHCF